MDTPLPSCIPAELADEFFRRLAICEAEEREEQAAEGRRRQADLAALAANPAAFVATTIRTAGRIGLPGYSIAIGAEKRRYVPQRSAITKVEAGVVAGLPNPAVAFTVWTGLKSLILLIGVDNAPAIVGSNEILADSNGIPLVPVPDAIAALGFDRVLVLDLGDPEALDSIPSAILGESPRKAWLSSSDICLNAEIFAGYLAALKPAR